MSQDTFIQELDLLVGKFSKDQAYYTSKAFQESELRVEFTSPLFEALGRSGMTESSFVASLLVT